jgi:hypothetical protein
MTTTTPDLPVRMRAAVAKLVQGHLGDADAATAAELLDALRDLAEAANTGALPRERCSEEADLVLLRIEELLARG